MRTRAGISRVRYFPGTGMGILIPTFVVSAGFLFTTAAAHAVPNADSTEEEGVCEILDNNGGDYHFAFNLAVIAVESDTGMNASDAAHFARKAINDRCPVYKDRVN
jgi:hypothetical protein